MPFSSPISHHCFQTLYRSYGSLVWGLFRGGLSDQTVAEAATIDLFHNLCTVQPNGHTRQSVLMAAYAVLAQRTDDATARQALRAVLLRHRDARRSLGQSVAAGL